jgi:N-acyl homoserine lactone hydrolase
MFPPVSIQLTSAGRPIRLHLFSTGKGRDKTRFREARLKNRLSTVDAILDHSFTAWLPVWVLVIEHPEGVFVVDTGIRTGISHPAYFRSSGLAVHWYLTTQFKFAIEREEEIDRQLAKRNISPDNTKAVILTHLHFDHTDGLRHFPNTPILLHKEEWEHPFGALPKRYPPWFKPTLLSLNTSCGPFKKARALTTTGDLLLVHTPGHTPGHCSVLLHTDAGHLLFAGDICYTQDQLLQEKYSANAASYRLARHTYAAVKRYAHSYPLIFLPSHDPDSATRLKHLQLLPIP